LSSSWRYSYPLWVRQNSRSKAEVRALTQHSTIEPPSCCISLFLCKILFSMLSHCTDVKAVQSSGSWM
jgi:hypothetical protein